VSDLGDITLRQPTRLLPVRRLHFATAQRRHMTITKLTPVWAAEGRVTHPHDLTYVRPYVPPPRIIVGMLTGDGALVPKTRQPVERER